jgi:phage-related minor tail protein
MALEASSLTITVVSQGIQDATKALNDLASAGEAAENKTSNIGSSTKSSGDAAKKAAEGFSALTQTVNNAVASQDASAATLKKIQSQIEKMDYSNWITSGKQAAAVQRQIEQADYDGWVQRGKTQKQAEEFITTLKRQADTVGMTTKELREYNAEILRSRAAQLGVSGQADEYINKLKGAKGAHEGLSLATAGTSRELLVLTHELATGQLNRFYGSLLVLGERMNVMPPIWKALGTAAEGMGVSFGVLLGGIVAVGVALGVAIMTYSKSATALKDMNKELVLTGGYAGATGDALYSMANQIGAAYGEFGKAREAVIALTATGKFTVDQINLIAEAAVGMAKYAGVSVEKTAAAFEKLAGNPLKITDKGFKDVSNAAMQLDEQMHFLEPTVLAHIMHLERQGEHASASRVAIAALAEEEKKRADELKAQLTPLGSLLDSLAQKASNFWNNLLHKGSMTDQIEKAKEDLQHARDNGVGPTRIKELENELAALQNKVIQDNYDAAEQGHKKTMDRLANEQLTYMRNLMERSKGEENLQQRLARFDNIIAQQREKAKNDPAFAAMAKDFLSDDAVAQMRKQVERDSIKAAPKPHTEGLSNLDKVISQINEEYEVQKRGVDNQIKLIDFKNKYGLKSDEDTQSEKEDLLDKAMNLEKDHLEKALKEIDNFHSKDVRLMNDAATKKANIKKQLDKVMSDIQLKQDENALVPDVNFAADQAKQQKEQDQILKQIERQTKAVQAQVDAYNKLPDAVKAVGVRQKEMASEVEQAKIDSLQVEKDSLQSNDLIEQAMNKRRIDQIDKEIAARKALKAVDVAKEANDKQNNTALNRSSALTKIATEQVKMWKDTGNEIERALTSAFGNAGAAAGKMFKSFAEGQASQAEILDKIRVVKEKDGLTEYERQKQINDLQLQGAQSQIGSYAGMADAASMFFEKGSTGYQAMAKAAQILHTAEVALSVIKGVNAILTQGEGDPYTAFARMAAMTAIVAGLGVAISGGGHGGGFSAADQQRIQGTGTVLGSPTITDGTKVILAGEKSNSIENSLKIAEKNSGLGLAVQNDMLIALQQLNNNITSFAEQLVRNTDLSNPNINLNSNNGFGKTAVTTTLVSAATAILGPIAGITTYIATKIPVIGNLLGKLGTSIFGGKQSLDDSGFTIGKTNLGNVMTGGLNAQSYANITTSGGWFSSDKHETKLSSLGKDTNDQISQVILSMSDTLKVAAKGLGIDGDAFNNKLKGFVIDIGKVSFKGMSGDEIQKTLQNVFSKLGDQMAQYAFSDLQKYQKIGEGLMETVVRVANDLQQFNDVMKVLGRSVPQAAYGIAQAEKLVESFGSSDALTKAVKSYEDAIYTDNEKLAPVIKSVQDSLASMGLSSIKTKEDFKLVVDSLDLTSDAGIALFNKLMTLAPTFGTAIDGLSKANQTTKDSMQSVIDKLKQFSDNIKKFRDGLVLSANSPFTPAQKLADAASQFENTITKAMKGDSNAQGEVTNIAQSYLDAARTMFASSDAYTEVFNKVEAELAKVQGFADNGVSDTQKQLNTMNDQLTSLNTLNGTASDILASLNNLVNGTAPATTATSNEATNAELLQTLKTIVGTLQQSDQNNVDALSRAAAATYDGHATTTDVLKNGLKALAKDARNSGALYHKVER